MAFGSIHGLRQPRTIASGRGFALLSTFVEGLPNTVLVQLLRSVCGTPAAYTLYTVYREGPMTFDAIAAFDVGQPRECLADMLKRFVCSAAFESAVMEPIRREADAHFGRSAFSELP